MISYTWHMLLVALAGWMNRQQQEVIEYLKEENRILREKLGPGRLQLTMAQKRRLASAAFKVGRKLLGECATFFSPETLLRWYRQLIAQKYDGSGKLGPKARKANEVRAHVLRMKADNPDWGYGHIHGELKGLGYKVSWQTVRRIMIEHGLLDDPKHKKKMPWSTFIKAHFESLAACDFFTVEAWTPKGLQRFSVLFAIDLSSRRVQIAGIDSCPDEQWMLQQARNLTDPEQGLLQGKRFLIHDRDPLITKEFRKAVKSSGVRALKLPKQSPNLNACCERFVQKVKNECTDKMIFLGEKHLRHVLSEFVAHYHMERPHQGLGNRRIDVPTTQSPVRGRIYCRERLGGLLKSYYRKAA
jgi:putative transposase